MNNPTLTRITLQTLENYRVAASQAVLAYRLGSKRLVGAVDSTLENVVYPRTAKMAPRMTERLDQMRGKLSGAVVKGIDELATRTEKALAMGKDAAATQLEQVAGYAAGIHNPTVANGLRAAARLSMPGAKAALVVSSKVAEGSTALVGAAGGKLMTTIKRKAAAGTRRVAAKTKVVAKRAGRAVKTAAPRAAKKRVAA